MAHKGTSQGQLHLIDEHGNRVHQIDDPNAIQGISMGFAPAGTSSDIMKKDHHEGQQLRHSCSSNSSSVSFNLSIYNPKVLLYCIENYLIKH